MIPPATQRLVELAAAGEVTVDAGVMSLWQAREHLHNVRDEVRARCAPNAPSAGVLADRIAAGQRPDVEQLVELAREVVEGEQVRAALAQLFDGAVRRVEQNLEEEVRAHVDEVFSDLQERLADVLHDVREVVGALGDVRTGDAALDAPPTVQAAYKRLPGLAERYHRLRSLHNDALRAAGSDTQWPEVFGSVRDAASLWPDWDRSRLDEAPWPHDPRALLLWSVESGYALWLPTKSELDAAAAVAVRDRTAAQHELAVATRGQFT